MQNVYILHGCCDRAEFEDTNIPSGSNFHWIPWLQKQLIVRGINCQTPEMPTPYKPIYKDWVDIFECFPIDGDTSLIGHSCGGGFLLRYLSEKPQPIKRLVLVAPWLDPKGYMEDFLDFDVRSDLVDTIEDIHILYSLDEPIPCVRSSVAELREVLKGISYHEFSNHGHFCLSDMGADAFPELLELVT